MHNTAGGDDILALKLRLNHCRRTQIQCSIVYLTLAPHYRFIYRILGARARTAFHHLCIVCKHASKNRAANGTATTTTTATSVRQPTEPNRLRLRHLCDIDYVVSVFVLRLSSEVRGVMIVKRRERERECCCTNIVFGYWFACGLERNMGVCSNAVQQQRNSGVYAIRPARTNGTYAMAINYCQFAQIMKSVAFEFDYVEISSIRNEPGSRTD